MVILVRKLDEVTFVAQSNSKLFLVWEFENDFIIGLHLMERRMRFEMGLDIEEHKIQ
jgi:hypothetical protein